jgi:glucan phosphoethanolaminetransferase (alkaline phosphatase superfamily)
MVADLEASAVAEVLEVVVLLADGNSINKSKFQIVKFSILSIILSLLTLFFSVKVNLSILNDYLNTDGKTQALYAFLELKYLYKYYFILFSLLSAFFLFFAHRKNELRNLKIIALLLLLLGITSIFLEIWKWFI